MRNHSSSAALDSENNMPKNTQSKSNLPKNVDLSPNDKKVKNIYRQAGKMVQPKKSNLTLPSINTRNVRSKTDMGHY